MIGATQYLPNKHLDNDGEWLNRKDHSSLIHWNSTVLKSAQGLSSWICLLHCSMCRSRRMPFLPKNRNSQFGSSLDQLIKTSLLVVKKHSGSYWRKLHQRSPSRWPRWPVEIFEGHGFGRVQDCTVFKVHPSSIHELLSFTNLTLTNKRHKANTPHAKAEMMRPGLQQTSWNCKRTLLTLFCVAYLGKPVDQEPSNASLTMEINKDTEDVGRCVCLFGLQSSKHASKCVPQMRTVNVYPTKSCLLF